MGQLLECLPAQTGMGFALLPIPFLVVLSAFAKDHGRKSVDECDLADIPQSFSEVG